MNLKLKKKILFVYYNLLLLYLTTLNCVNILCELKYKLTGLGLNLTGLSATAPKKLVFWREGS